jgi:regulator of sirC expression with transglutaminase-like and TPR domain
MDVTARFAELVTGPEESLALDEATLLVAAHAHEVDIDARLSGLDELAASAPAGDAAVLAHHLFVDLGFRGNVADYADPRNSYLDAVLDRRLGLPITLSIVMLEVARRRGLALHGVGMPGHFLVGTGERWLDPFHAGAVLDDAGCVAQFSRASPGVPFRREFLAPVGPRAIVQRVLANLHATLVSRDPASVAWVVRLRLLVPGLAPAERVSLATALGELGRFAEAARELDRAATDLPAPASSRATAAAARFRSRAN